MPVTIKTGVGGGSVTLDSGSGVLDTTLTLPNINGTVLYSDANGNVGIGTASPQAKFVINTTLDGSQAIFIGNQSTTEQTLLFRNQYYTNNPTAGVAAIGWIDSGSSGGILTFKTGTNGGGVTNIPTERMRINSSGYLGIGTTSPSAPLDVLVSAGGVSPARFISSASGGGNIYLGCTNASTTVNGYIGPNAYTNNVFAIGVSTSTPLTFLTAATECGRFDANGNFLVGTTSAFVSGTGTKVQNLSAYGSRNSGAASGKYWTFAADGSNSFVIFNQTPTGVYVADGGTSWNAFSDERLKTDLVPITDAVSKVSTLRAVTGRLKTDEEGTSRVFLIAQDVQAVLPEAVHVGEDEDKTLGLAYTEVIPLLVAAIKELSAKNDALEARLAALENK
jgi:hypothetical protein